MKDKVEIGKFYANEYIDEDGRTEKNIILVISEKDGSFKTETLWITEGDMGDLYSNDWLPQFIQRKATQDEVDLFNQERNKIDDQLRGYVEVVTGNRLIL